MIYIYVPRRLESLRSCFYSYVHLRSLDAKRLSSSSSSPLFRVLPCEGESPCATRRHARCTAARRAAGEGPAALTLSSPPAWHTSGKLTNARTTAHRARYEKNGCSPRPTRPAPPRRIIRRVGRLLVVASTPSDAAASASRITSLSIVATVTALSDGHATVGAAVAHEQLGACAGENHDDGLPWFRSVSAALFGTGWTAVSGSCVA